MMLNLQQAVERIVAPIPAEEREKNKYRLELYAHLHGLFEQELAQHGDEADALDAALKRLGDAESLRTEFLKSLSLPSRFMGRVEYALDCNPGESIWRHSVRIGGMGMAIYFTAVYGLLIPLAFALKDESLDMTIAIGAFGIVMGLSLPTMLIAISYLQFRTRQIMDSASTVPIKYLRMIGASVWSALAIWVVALGSTYVLLAVSENFQAHTAVALLDHVRTEFAPRFCWVLTVIVVVLPFLIQFDRRSNGYINDWPYAE